MTAQGGLGIHFPNIYKKGVIFVKEPSPPTLGLQFRDAWTREDVCRVLTLPVECL